MAFGRRKQTAWATGLSLVLHVLVLTGMVLGLKVVTPPPEERAMEVRLLQPPPLPEVAARPPATPQEAQASPVLKPHVTPRPAPSVPGVALPEVKAPPAPPAPLLQPYGPVQSGGLKPGLSGRMGCDAPLGFKLDEAQKQACANNMAERAREAGSLGFAMNAAKERRFDRNANCRQAMHAAGIPTAADTEFLPQHSALPPGLVPTPSFKDCPLSDR